MVTVPAAGAAYDYVAKGIEIEGDDAHGVDEFPWEAHRSEHSHTMALASFHIDKFPATSAQTTRPT